MNNNIRIAKQLVKIAKSLVTLDEEGDGSGVQVFHDMGKDGLSDEARLDRAEKAGKKYILYKKERGLWRIMACKDFSDVKKGDLGGFVSSEENLSHEGDCWIYGESKVYGSAKVWDNAGIHGNAKVFDRAKIYGNAKVSSNAEISGDSEVCDHAWISGDADVFDRAKISGNTDVYDNAWIYGDAEVYGHAEVYGNAKVYGHAGVFGNAAVYGESEIYDRATVDYEVSEGEVTE